MAMTYSTRRGLPVQVRFVATDITGVTLIGPDQEIAKADPVPVQVGSTDVYTCVVTPDEWGTWLLVTDDGAGNVTSTTEIECRPALATESTYESLVPVWPTGILGAAPSAYAPMNAELSRSFVNVNKIVAPTSGLIWGCSVYVAADTDHAATLRFFTVSPTGYLRGVSDNLLALTPDSGTWAAGGWVTVRFTKPVPARALDQIGLEITMAVAADYLGVQPLNAAHVSSLIGARDGALDASGAMTFTTNVAAPAQLALKPLILPPDVVVAGHSIMAGHGSGSDSPLPSLTVYELCATTDYPLNERDLAIQLQALTGRRCVNVADGGTASVAWIPATTGLFATNIAPLRPRVVLWDALCNEGQGVATTQTRMDVLLSLCSSINAELVVVEGVPIENFQIAGTAEAYNLLRSAVEWWCRSRGVRLIRTVYAMGEHAGDSALASRFNQTRGVKAGTEYLVTAGLSSYSSADGTHLSATGQIAFANAIARGLLGSDEGAAKHAMIAAAILGSKASVSGDTVTFYSADNTTELAKTTVDGGTRGQRTVAVIP